MGQALPFSAPNDDRQHFVVRHLGMVTYEKTWRAMRQFTLHRHQHTVDELWLLQHPQTYTLGRSGVRRHILNVGDIPLVHSDRGGQITYHGPGQLVVYLLMNLRRQGVDIRRLIFATEEVIIRMLSDYGISARRKKGAPGVYVGAEKIAALGYRISRGYSYHGSCINIDMDLAPYAGINPCGHAHLPITSIAALKDAAPSIADVGGKVITYTRHCFGYKMWQQEQGLPKIQ